MERATGGGREAHRCLAGHCQGARRRRGVALLLLLLHVARRNKSSHVGAVALGVLLVHVPGYSYKRRLLPRGRCGCW